MVTEVIDKYKRAKNTLESLMKIVQRDFPNDKLKVEILNNLIEVKEKLDNDGKESNG